MSVKNFWHWLWSMAVSAIAAWFTQHHPSAAIPCVFATGCACHWIGQVGAKSDDEQHTS